MRYGLASRDITPREAVWLSGYAARTKPSEGVYQPLLARVLALADGERRLLWVTCDLLGLDYALAGRLLEAITAATGVPDEGLLLSLSHTHCGPAIRANDREVFGPDIVAGQDDALVQVLPDLCREALANLRDGSLAFGVGHSTMAVHRRLTVDGQSRMLPNPAGPIDPDVAVLAVHNAGGDLAAAVVSYACHPTTMGGQLIGPDWPGFLRRGVEEARPGCQVLFANGCAGDVKPRNVTPDGKFAVGTLEAVERCGREVAASALAVLDGPLRPVTGRLRSAVERIELRLQEAPSRAALEATRQAGDRWQQLWASKLLARLDSGERLPRTRQFVARCVRIGDAFVLATLGGEVCVGVGRRVKDALRAFPAVMVVAYTDAIAGYVAARDQFAEGGYEVDHWYRYGSGLPAPFDPGVEDQIVAAVEHLARDCG